MTWEGARGRYRPLHERAAKQIERELKLINKLQLGNDDYRVKVDGDVNPACRLIFKELMRHYGGNFEKVMTHVKVRRLVLSEQDAQR